MKIRSVRKARKSNSLCSRGNVSATKKVCWPAVFLAALCFPFSSLAQVKIGVIAPQTGEVAVWGKGMTRSIELAHDAFPGSFRFIYEDEQFCDTTRALSAAKKLIEIDKVKYLITGCLNGTKAIAGPAARAGVPVFSGGLLDQASIDGFDHVVSLSAQIGSEGALLADYARAQSYSRVFVFRHDDNFTGEFMRSFSERFIAVSGVAPIDVPVGPGSFPWASELAKARKSKPDAIVVYLGNDQLLSFMKARAQLQDRTPLLGGYVIESNFDAAQFGEILNGIRYTFPDLPPSNDDSRAAFERNFRARFGSSDQPTVNSYFIYDGLSILSRALSDCGGGEFDCVWQRFLNSGKPHRGISGEFQFLGDGSVKRTFIIKEIRGKEFIRLPS